MSEPILEPDAAKVWLRQHLGVSRETIGQLEALEAMTVSANERQNLVAASTLTTLFWSRHILDSAQLLPLAPAAGGRWVDLGSGAGFPGLVVAVIAPQWDLTLVESRHLRCEHLRHLVGELGLADRVRIAETRVEALHDGPYDVISARAFAPLARLIGVAQHLAGATTRWLLPKGRNARLELSSVPPAWQRRFEMVPSLTDADAHILVGTGHVGASLAGGGRNRPLSSPLSRM